MLKKKRKSVSYGSTAALCRVAWNHSVENSVDNACALRIFCAGVRLCCLIFCFAEA